MVAGGDTSFMSDTSTGSPLSDTVTSTRPLTGRQASDRPRGYSNASMERGTIRCAGRLWIFFVLGTLVIVVGMVIGGLYLNIRNVTTSSQHTEVVPTYVVALLVIATGIFVILLFWRRPKVLVFMSILLCVATAFLTGVTAVLTGTHIIRPLESFTYCRYYDIHRQCQCLSPYKKTLLTIDYSMAEQTSFTFVDVTSCESVQSFLPQLVYTLCAVYTIVFILTVISAILASLVYRLEKAKMELFDEDNYEDIYTVGGSSSAGGPASAQSDRQQQIAASQKGKKSSIDSEDSVVRRSKREHVRRSQSFVEASTIGSSNESLDDIDKIYEASSSRTRRNSTGATASKLKPHRRRHRRAVTIHNLDTHQLMLILSLQMRYIQETQDLQAHSSSRNKSSPAEKPFCDGRSINGRPPVQPPRCKSVPPQLNSPAVSVTMEEKNTHILNAQVIFAQKQGNSNNSPATKILACTPLPPKPPRAQSGPQMNHESIYGRVTSPNRPLFDAEYSYPGGIPQCSTSHSNGKSRYPEDIYRRVQQSGISAFRNNDPLANEPGNCRVVTNLGNQKRSANQDMAQGRLEHSLIRHEHSPASQEHSPASHEHFRMTNQLEQNGSAQIRDQRMEEKKMASDARREARRKKKERRDSKQNNDDKSNSRSDNGPAIQTSHEYEIIKNNRIDHNVNISVNGYIDGNYFAHERPGSVNPASQHQSHFLCENEIYAEVVRSPRIPTPQSSKPPADQDISQDGHRSSMLPNSRGKSVQPKSAHRNGSAFTFVDRSRTVPPHQPEHPQRLGYYEYSLEGNNYHPHFAHIASPNNHRLDNYVDLYPVHDQCSDPKVVPRPSSEPPPPYSDPPSYHERASTSSSQTSHGSVGANRNVKRSRIPMQLVPPMKGDQTDGLVIYGNNKISGNRNQDYATVVPVHENRNGLVNTLLPELEPASQMYRLQNGHDSEDSDSYEMETVI